MARTASGARVGVVTGHELATDAALATLDAGGALADAAIAASAVLAVVSTHSNSLGSDGFALLRQGDRVHVLNASGRASRHARHAHFAGGMPDTGPRAAVVPGLVPLWGALHGRCGRLPWGRLFEAAIRAATDGHVVSPVLLRNLAVERARVGAMPGFADVYLPGGAPLAPGATFRQPALGRTLEAIATGGVDAFRRGPIARTIVATVAAHGGLLDADDFAAFEPQWGTPIATGYRTRRIVALPPNAYGVLALAQLNGLATLDPARLRADDPARLDVLMRAAFAALAEVKPRVTDPEACAEASAAILGDAATARIAAALHGAIPPGPTSGGAGTTATVIADRSGDAIVLMQSNFQPFGCGVLDADTGVLLNNRMLCFSNDPADVNVVAPGKRPAHTHSPLIVEDADGRLSGVVATPGGISQTITCTQVLVNLIDRGLDAAEAIDLPRWSTDRSGARVLEEGFDESVAPALRALGHPVRVASGSNFFGSVKAVLMEGTGVRAVADTRREAVPGTR